MLLTLAISGYRSLRNIVVPLDQLTVVTGANGAGKSSLYRAVRLLASASQNGLAHTLAAEGGFNAALWAGPESLSREMKAGIHPVQGTVRSNVVAIKLGFTTDDFGYAMDIGLPAPGSSVFTQDPEIKCEDVWAGESLRPANVLIRRRNGMVKVRGDHDWNVVRADLATYDSVFAADISPRSAPELVDLRERMRGWRFYDQLRTDVNAPARQPQMSVRTPVLGHDGRDIASAVATLSEIGDKRAFRDAISDAFPGHVSKRHFWERNSRSR